MIQMGMGHEDGIQIARPDSADVPVAVQVFPFLEHPAVYQQVDAGRIEVVLRTGDLSRGPEELVFQRNVL